MIHMSVDPIKQRQDQKTNTELESGQKAVHTLEFKTAEELIRHDRGQTLVPEGLAGRLNQALEKEKRPVSWWRWLWGKRE